MTIPPTPPSEEPVIPDMPDPHTPEVPKPDAIARSQSAKVGRVYTIHGLIGAQRIRADSANR
jgi:hypothetical protein